MSADQIQGINNIFFPHYRYPCFFVDKCPLNRQLAFCYAEQHLFLMNPGNQELAKGKKSRKEKDQRPDEFST